MAFGTFGFDKKNIDLNSSAFFEELQEVQVKKVTQHKRELTIRDLPEGITMGKVDIDNPPGLAGTIVEYMRIGAHRELSGGAYALGALQIMSIAACGLRGYRGANLSMITFTLAVSAAGKERIIESIKELAGDVGLPVYGDIRSDKDISMALVHDGACARYIINEAQKILGNDAVKGNKMLKFLPDAIMDISTSNQFNLPKNHVIEIQINAQAKAARLDKQIAAKQKVMDELNPTEEVGKRKALELEIAKLEEEIKKQVSMSDAIANGVKNPQINLATYSTPQKLAEIVDTDSIESGFLGRALFVDCGEERAELKMPSTEEWDNIQEALRGLRTRIAVRLGMIKQLSDDEAEATVESAFSGRELRFVLDSEASQDMDAITRHYEHNEYRNNPQIGPIFARIAQRVAVVASVMALDNIDDNYKAVITRPMVRYGLALSLTGAGCMIERLRINDATEREDSETIIKAAEQVLIRMMTTKANDKDQGWRYTSTVKQRFERSPIYASYRAMVLSTKTKVDTTVFGHLLQQMMVMGKVEKDGAKIRLAQGSGNVVGM